MPERGEKKRPWFQYHLSTLIVTCVVASLFVPALVFVAVRSAGPLSAAPKNVAETFGLGCVALLSLIAWRVRPLQRAIFAWAGVSVALGLLGSFVPFGGACVSLAGAPPPGFAGFCGEGVPIPLVMWKDGCDYPNPLGLFMNPICIFGAGALVLLLVRSVMVAIRFLLGVPSGDKDASP